MPIPKPTIPAAAEPKLGKHFDVWHSSGGHQRPDNNIGASAGWRQSRSVRLTGQFKGRATGVELSNSNKARTLIPGGERANERAQRSVIDMFREQGKIVPSNEERWTKDSKIEEAEKENADTEKEKEEPVMKIRGIFDGLVVYINGSTYPLISDHKLKQVLAENGARVAIHLGRRRVTHVILGKPAGLHVGAGGGLAGGKLDREIRRVGGCGVKYVGVEWVLESMKAGRRLAEAPFATLKIAAKGQRSVYGMFEKTSSTGSSAVA